MCARRMTGVISAWGTLEALVWTRGSNFALSSLDGRLTCPRCGSRHVRSVSASYRIEVSQGVRFDRARNAAAHLVGTDGAPSPTALKRLATQAPARIQ